MSVNQPSASVSVECSAEGKTWPERLWLKNRGRFWWQLPILAMIDAWLILSLYLAATRGIAYGGPRGHRVWFSIQDRPADFWTSVVKDVVTLAFGVGVPLWVAYSLHRLKTERANSASHVAAQDPVQSGADRGSNESWEERLWQKSRRRLWWLLPLLAAIVVWFAGAIYIDVTEGFPSAGRLISIHADPVIFWLSSSPVILALALCLGMPLWVAYRLRGLRVRRTRPAQSE